MIHRWKVILSRERGREGLGEGGAGGRGGGGGGGGDEENGGSRHDCMFQLKARNAFLLKQFTILGME